jgi:hypothetical protein
MIESNAIMRLTSVMAILSLFSCGSSVRYSFTGTSTAAKTISITEFYNNADLGPANMGQNFTNQLKNYFIQNTNISVVAGEGELQMEGEIVDLRLTPIAPVNSGSNDGFASATSTRLTITVKATYINNLDESMSFKNKTFSFYRDFPNEANLTDIEEQYTRDIFERIINDIFNASVANW